MKSSLPILFLLCVGIYTQACYPLRQQISNPHSLATNQLSSFKYILGSSKHSAQSSSNSGLSLACNTAYSIPISIPVQTSTPVATTIRITGNFPTTPAVNHYVGSPAYYQATGIFPWGGLTSMKFDTSNYVAPTQQAQISSASQTTTQTQTAFQPNQQISVQPIYPTQSQTSSQTQQNDEYSFTNTSPSVIQTIPQQINIPIISTITSTPQVNFATQTIPINQIQSYIPPISSPVTPTINVIPFTQQASTQTTTITNYQGGGGNLIPIVGDVPVPVSHNYFGEMVPVRTVSAPIVTDSSFGQFASSNNVITAPAVSTLPVANIPISTQTVFTQPVTTNLIPISGGISIENRTTTQIHQSVPTLSTISTIPVSSSYSTTTVSSTNSPNAILPLPIDYLSNANVDSGSSSSSYSSSSQTQSETQGNFLTDAASLPVISALAPLDIQNFGLNDLNLAHLFKDYGTHSGDTHTNITTTTKTTSKSSQNGTVNS